MKAVPFFLALIPVCLFSQAKPTDGQPVELRCEYLVVPLGIDNPNPRMTWKIEDNRQDAVQSAYRVLVDTDSMAVVNDRGQVWDTGKQASEDILLTFAGKQLLPQTRYFWKVIAWDKDEKANASAVSAFETGKMGNAQWQGAWISDHHDIHYKPAPYFRKEFTLKKDVARA